MKTKQGNYFLGLDIGTNSVGWAATNDKYELLEYNNHPMWGVHLFDEASICAERRSFRTARRRLQRRKQRVALLQELFKDEIAKVDPRFFVRLKESALYREDKSDTNDTNTLFNDLKFGDKEYHIKYPTIHHLISAQIDGNEDALSDVRLLYLSCSWILKHRGHFLNELDVENIDKLNDFGVLYSNFEQFFENNGYSLPWASNLDGVSKILRDVKGVKRRVEAFEALLFDGEQKKKYDVVSPESEFPFKRSGIIGILAGGVKGYKDLYVEDDESMKDLKIDLESEELDVVIQALGDDGGLIIALKAMYDWAQLCEILQGNEYISKAKMEIFNKHKNDLIKFKAFVKKYYNDKYLEIFGSNSNKDKELKNYAAYVGHNCQKNAKQADFYDFLKKVLGIKDGKIINNEILEDKEYVSTIISEIETRQFLPKQVVGENRVIPYQLYYKELEKILSNSVNKFTFLENKDEYGTIVDKILSIMKFKIPYFVGPLNPNSQFAWIVRKAGVITPWNFKDIVDEDASEKAFINNMTNKCTYLPEEDVLPRYSLVYSRFTVLNEINNICVDGERISVEAKQAIFNDLCCRKRKITKKMIANYLLVNKYVSEGVEISGVDDCLTSNYKSYFDFKEFIEKGILSELQVEDIISMRTYTEDNARFKKWLINNYSSILSQDSIHKISKFKYDGFGRFSRKLLSGIEFAVDGDESRKRSAMINLWETNYNFMELLSAKFEFSSLINDIRKEYYGEKDFALSNYLSDRFISNAVKRQIYRTYDVVKDIVNTKGSVPAKIFVEMARGGTEEQKGKRTISRYKQIEDIYKSCKKETVELNKELKSLGGESKLDSRSLFLYFTQMGKCMYCGKSLHMHDLKSTCDLDHIIPQSIRKDDSILNNLVLVCKDCNGRKTDFYPLNKVPNYGSKWQQQQMPFWKWLRDINAITGEKFNRLIRTRELSIEEKEDFINRQLVETRQSTKLITSIFGDLFPNTEIVYVKAGLVSEFRHEYDIVKVRSINDLHHAKDAYLNIVVGNVYNEKFTKKYFDIRKDKYSLNTNVLFERPLARNNKTIWGGKEDIAKVKGICFTNDIHLTKYAVCKKGGLFDQMIVKKAPGKVSIKANNKLSDTSKYGGYNKPGSAFFVLVKCKIGKDKDVVFVPFDMMYKDLILKGQESKELLAYIKSNLEQIWNKPISEIKFPLGLRQIKINTILSLDGELVTISGKANRGQIVGLSPFSSIDYLRTEESKMICYGSGKNEKFSLHKYIKIVENILEKQKIDDKYAEYSGLSKDLNNHLFKYLVNVYEKHRFMPGFSNANIATSDSLEKFNSLNIEKQIICLNNLISMFKTNRKGGVDLSLLDFSSKTAVCCVGAKLSSLKKNYKNICVLDMSPAGLHIKKSTNLLDFLED